MEQVFPLLRWVLATVGAVVSVASQAQTVYGLVPGLPSLITFQATAPGTFTAAVPITGIAAGQTIVGLDSRPSTGELFAAGYNPASTQVQLYTISPATGAAAAAGPAIPLNLGTATRRIGFDFDPTVDRIRLTGANNSNFRLDPTNGALTATDGPFAYASTDANAGQTPAVSALAYTNSYAGSTGTTLYALDEASSRLTVQSPPNNGTLNTVGSLGANVTPFAATTDVDIYYDGATGANVGGLVAAYSTGGAPGTTTQFSALNLATGAATAVGRLPQTGGGVTNIAYQIRPLVPTAVSRRLEGASAPRLLLYPNPSSGGVNVSFALARPGRVELSVFDAMGRRVAAQTSGPRPAGPQSLRWELGSAKAGLYTVRLVAEGHAVGSGQVTVE